MSKQDIWTLNLFAVGQRLKREREAMRVNQSVIADLLGVNKSQVSRLENGETMLNVLHLMAYANATMQPVELLLRHVLEWAEIAEIAEI